MDYKFDELPVGISCHPSKNCFTAGFIDGNVELFEYEINDNNEIKLNCQWSRKHKAAVRKIKFSTLGDRVFTLTRNKAFTQWDAETGKKLRCIRVAHENAPYSMCVVNENQTATGDDGGTIKFWDWRNDKDPCSFELSETDEYITDMVSGNNDKLLLATSGDCTLISVDVRKKKMVLQSETMHSELLSLASMEDEKKLVCGAADGYLEVFNWNEFGNIVERISTKHKDTIDCLQTIGRNLIASGSADGTIRLINVSPNKSLGIVGGHDEGVEGLCLTFDDSHLVSCGHDCKVKFWNLKSIKSMAPKTRSGSKMKKIIGKKRSASAFFDDLSE